MKTDKDEDKERRVKEQNKSGFQICQTCKEEAPIGELVGGLGGAQCLSCRKQQQIEFRQGHPSCQIRVISFPNCMFWQISYIKFRTDMNRTSTQK